MSEEVKRIRPVEVTLKESDDHSLLWIRLLRANHPELQAGELGVEALIGLRQDLTVTEQSQLINAARAILNEMEASLRGGVGATPGAKTVQA